MELKSLILSLSSIGENMEREGRKEGEGAFYYLWIPFKFIYQTLRSLLFKLFGLRTPSNQTFQEEEVEVVEVSSRGLRAKPKLQQKSKATSGKPGSVNKKPS
ncbi:elicitor peptide 4 [Raphanus sativus]|uniref:Elicitor peptide 4 n=1 Tax=Raphanus sativus TaxID=3726 RepID=A0A6J0K9Z1_RAPSA|nr:elicitor peptide 4 [Raphanus sativus]